MRNDVILSSLIHCMWWTLSSNRMNACIFRCNSVFWCQNISPPFRVCVCGPITTVCVRFPMLRGCMLSDENIFIIYICVSCDTLVNAHTLSISVSLFHILPISNRISGMYVQIFHLEWKTSQWFGRKFWQFNRDTQTDRIDSFRSNGIYFSVNSLT